MTAAEFTCPSCGAPILAEDRYCEECGATLTANGSGPAVAGVTAAAATPGAAAVPAGAEAPGSSGPPVGPAGSVAGPAATTAPTSPPRANEPCVGCGAPPESIGADGYCEQCGLRQPDPRDHEEVDLGIAAGVSDRGLHHHRNEDAMLVRSPSAEVVVAVVCDGVSSSVKPELASRAAADTAGVVLMQALTSRPHQLTEAFVDAAAAAQAAVVDIPWTPEGMLAAPSCTFVAATVAPGAVTVGWIGDSRAYWVDATEAKRLTADDSWAGEMTAAGLMTEAQAEADNRSHAITRWLGADAPAGDPHVATFTPPVRGRLVVCSDGLWNYLSAPEQLIELLGGDPATGALAPLPAAQALNDFALAAGGHDNITVVVIEVTPPESKGEA